MPRTLPLVFLLFSLSPLQAEPKRDADGDPLPEGAVARLGSQRFRPAVQRFGDLKAAVTPDNKMLITAEWRGLRFWDLATGRETGFILTPGGEILELTISPDSKRFAVTVDDYGPISRPFGETDRTIHVGDIAPKKLVWKTKDDKLTVPTGWSSAVFSADSKTLIVRCELQQLVNRDQLVIFDSATGENVGALDRIYTFQQSPDGKRIARGMADGNVSIHDLGTLKEQTSFKALDGPICRLTWSPDGKQIAVGGGYLRMEQPDSPPHGDLRVRVWDIGTSKGVFTAKVEKPVAQLSFSPDGALLSVREDFWQAWVFDLATQKPVWSTRDAAKDKPTIIDAGNGQKRSFEVRENELLRVRAEKDAQELWSWWAVGPWTHRNESGRVSIAALSPDGKTIIGNGSGLTVVDALTGKDRADHGGHRQPVDSLRMSPDGRFLLSIDEGKSARIWRLSDGASLFSEDRGRRVAGADFIAEGKEIVALGRDGTVRVYDPAEKRVVRSFTIKEAFHPRVGKEGEIDQRFIHAISKDGLVAMQSLKSVEIWDANNGQKVARLPDFETEVTAIRFAPDGKHCAVKAGNEVRLLDVRGKQTARWPLGRTEIDFAPVFAGDSKWLAWIDSDKIAVVPLDNPKRAVALSGTFYAFGMSGDGTLLAAHERSFAIRVVQIPSLKEVRRFLADDERSTQREVDFLTAPDGRLLADVSLDPKHSRWALIDLLTGRRIVPNADAFHHLAISPDCRFVAAGSGDIQLYEALTGMPIGRFPDGHRGEVSSIAFSTNGKHLITGGSEGTILVCEWAAACGISSKEPARIDSLWNDLRDADPAKACRALFAMKNNPAETIAFLRERLKPANEKDAARIRSLIDLLDDDDFRKRSAASKELNTLGAEAEPFLHAALPKAKSAEAERTIQKLLADPRLVEMHPDTVRAFRAIYTLELIGSEDARGLLKELANGAPGMLLTREAQLRLR